MAFTAQSSHLMTYDYDTQTKTLRITFHNGQTYQYDGVTIDDFNALMQGGGGGTVFWQRIRSKYTAIKIDAPPEEEE